MYCYNHTVVRDYIEDDSDATQGRVVKIMQAKELELKAFVADATYYNNQGRTIAMAYDAKAKRDLFIVEDLLAFSWSAHGDTISYTLFKDGTVTLLNYWLLHVFLPLYFSHQRTYFFFHVGSVLIAHRAVGFLAPCHGGKSTLTDFFLKQGHTLMTDDKLGTFKTQEGIYAVASYPYHRPYRAVEDIGFKVENFAQRPYPLQALYILVHRDADAAVDIKEIKGIEKFKQLRYAAEMNYGVDLSNETAYLADVANSIALYSIDVPWDMNRLDAVYKAIIKHAKLNDET